jgi:hypothetical protein
MIPGRYPGSVSLLPDTLANSADASMPQLPQRQSGISRHPKPQATIADKTTGFCNTIPRATDVSGFGRHFAFVPEAGNQGVGLCPVCRPRKSIVFALKLGDVFVDRGARAVLEHHLLAMPLFNVSAKQLEMTRSCRPKVIWVGASARRRGDRVRRR